MTEVLIEEKKCSKCGEVKPISEFRPRKNYSFGVSCRCIECDRAVNREVYQRHREKHLAKKKEYNEKNRERRNEWAREWRQKNLEERREYERQDYHKNKARYKKAQIRYTYGIDWDEYVAMKESQDYKCAICEEEATLCVDHCHETNAVRGLLCKKCNTAIGLLKDKVGLVEKALTYLKKYE